MCIAILSEFGVGYPDKTIMKRCYRYNPDGVGYAYLTENDEWQVKKGYMTWGSFIDAWEKEDFKPEHTVALHFRVGTSGKMENGKCSPDCTHPFPVSDKEEELMAHQYVKKSIILHNGTVGRGEYPLSDTQVAIRDYVNTLLPYMDDPKIRTLLIECLDAGLKGSRWWMATGSKSYLMGNWIKDEESGIYYSNDGYLPGKDLWSSWAAWYKNQGGEETVCGKIKRLVGRFAYEYMSGSTWSWDKWERDFSTDMVEYDKQHQTYDGVTEEVFDKDGKQIAIVNSEGLIMWNEEEAEEKIKICPDCGGDFSLYSCVDNQCPFCYADLSVEFEFSSYKCPNCGERNYLIDSTYSMGDTECVRCGALFLDTTGEIVGWNEETKHERDETIKWEKEM